MNIEECRRLNTSLDGLGMRARGTSVGLLQLLTELHNAGVLSEEAIVRIREAIVSDIALSCPRSVQRDDYRNMVRQRLDGILHRPSNTTAAPEPVASH